jgi:four helix bundle protein
MSSPTAAKSTRVVTRTHRDLIVWKEGMRLLAEVYRLTADLPVTERYGLSSQLRRAVVSIPSNIAEGFGRRASGELRHSLSIAEGSLRELQTLIEATELLGYLPQKKLQAAIDTSNRVGYLLHRFRQKVNLERSRPRQP